jgi:preprotein translocase subunit SecG
MLSFVMVLMMIISVLLTVVVLLQPGKGGMTSSLAGLSGQFSSMFGTRKAVDFLSKLTIGLAVAIMLLSLVANIWLVGIDENVRKPVTEGAQLPPTNANPLNQPALPQQQPQQQQPAPQPGK